MAELKFTTEDLRERRRKYLASEAEVERLSSVMDGSTATSDAEAYYDARDELHEEEAALYRYALLAVKQGLSDDRYAVELALGDHDTDGGLD